jgi:hypothetical protein
MMFSMTINLPTSRSRCGSLTLAREDGQVLLDSRPAAGLASSALAAKNGNEARDPVLPYGHAPTGTFRLAGVYASGEGTRLPARYYGPHGIIALKSVTGQALLASGAGRGDLLIHGGPAGPNDSLRSTAGSVRLSNADMLSLISLIGSAKDLSCLCYIDDEAAGANVYDDFGCRLPDTIDPSILVSPHEVRPRAPQPVSRRNLIRAAGAAFVVPISFVAATTEIAVAQSY